MKNPTRHLTQKLEGQVSVERLQGYAIAFVVIGVVLTVGLSILGGIKAEMVLTDTVTGEGHQPATPLPTNVTVDKQSDSTFVKVVADSETVVFYDSSAGTNTTLTDGTDYVSYYDVGKFDIQNTSATTDYDSSTDNIFVDYSAEMEDTDSRNGATSAIDGLSTFTDWLPIIALVVVSAIIIGLVSMFRGNSGRRGRA